MAAILATTAVVASGTAYAAPAAPEPQLTLVAAAATVNLERIEGDPGNWLSLGTYVVAGAQPFEIRVTRATYSRPLVAKQSVVERGRKKTRTLPAGLVTSFGGLTGFTHVTLTDETGQQVFEKDEDFCPNTFETVRTRVGAPDSTPYPQYCTQMPFTLGGVWGIQAGWSAQTAPELPTFGPIDVPDGSYTATVSVNEPYRTLFGVPADQSSVTVAMNLTTVADPGSPALKAKANAHAGHQAAPHDMTTHGEATTDSAPGLHPQKRRPTGVRTLAAAATPKPDLRSLPAWWVNLSKEPDDERDYLSFDATVWNAGTSPLVVDGFRRAGTDLMDAYQYFFDSAGTQVGYRAAGTMEWDSRDGHHHWHFTDFAQYRLLDEAKEVVVRSGKEAFCLANTDQVDYTVPNAKWRPTNTDLATACGRENSLAVRQVLDIGNGDTYAQYLPGQSFDITDVPNGTYYIEVAANPENRLAETDTTNNTSHRKVILGGEPGARTLEVPPHQGIDG